MESHRRKSGLHHQACRAFPSPKSVCVGWLPLEKVLAGLSLRMEEGLCVARPRGESQAGEQHVGEPVPSATQAMQEMGALSRDLGG